MRRILAVLSIGALGIAGASAQGLHAVRPIPGYACMMPKLGDVRSFADLPRIMEYPDPASKPVGLAGTIVLARNPLHIENGYAEVLRFDGHPGWISADGLQPYHSASNPEAHCVPSIMSNGLPGIGS